MRAERAGRNVNTCAEKIDIGVALNGEAVDRDIVGVDVDRARAVPPAGWRRAGRPSLARRHGRG